MIEQIRAQLPSLTDPFLIPPKTFIAPFFEALESARGTVVTMATLSKFSSGRSVSGSVWHCNAYLAENKYPWKVTREAGGYALRSDYEAAHALLDQIEELQAEIEKVETLAATPSTKPRTLSPAGKEAAAIIRAALPDFPERIVAALKAKQRAIADQVLQEVSEVTGVTAP